MNTVYGYVTHFDTKSSPLVVTIEGTERHNYQLWYKLTYLPIWESVLKRMSDLNCDGRQVIEARFHTDANGQIVAVTDYDDDWLGDDFESPVIDNNVVTS